MEATDIVEDRVKFTLTEKDCRNLSSLFETDISQKKDLLEAISQTLKEVEDRDDDIGDLETEIESLESNLEVLARHQPNGCNYTPTGNNLEGQYLDPPIDVTSRLIGWVQTKENLTYSAAIKRVSEIFGEERVYL